MSLTLRQKSGQEKMRALVILSMMMIAVVAFTTKRRNKEYKTSTTQKSEKEKEIEKANLKIDQKSKEPWTERFALDEERKYFF